ncbi:MAG: response regulator [Mucilaginibacter sp.]|uniref:response regulator n=1 Tax=Mucilaginibacter sp. TaxID=1882438 RepID=UPI0031AE103D
MPKKVLIIEDNNQIRENVVEILELAGYEVYAANNGKAGIDLANKEVPDLVLCDIMMPELDGYGVIFMLGKSPQTAAIPFIFLTAKAERADLRKGMELGADDYLTKPFDDMELLNAIESRLKKQEAQKKVYSQSLDRLQQLIAKSGGLTELKRIIMERKSRVFKKNQVIYYESDKAVSLHLVINGRVKTCKIAPDGRELMTGIFFAENYLGIRAVLSHENYSDTAIALEDSTLVSIPTDMLEPVLNEYPEMAREFIKLLAGDIREKEEQLLNIAYQSVRKRLAEAILRLYHKDGVNIKIYREDLAAMIGIASETVSRTLSDFKEEQLIEKKGSTITVLDAGRLAKMKN